MPLKLINYMKYLYTYNPPEVAFHVWVSNFPFSGHPLDDERFYSFILTVHKYKRQGKKWRKRDYFIKRIREYGFRQDESELNEKYEQMILILDFIETKAFPIIRKTPLHKDEFEEYESTFFARAVVKNKLLYRDISEEIYKNNKVKKDTFKD